MNFPWSGQKISAVLFDMDGTLVDSESLSSQIIEALLKEKGIQDPDIDYEEFYGVTWEEISDTLLKQFSVFNTNSIAEELHRRFHTKMLGEGPQIVPGAVEAVKQANTLFPCGIVSSSNRETVKHIVQRLNLSQSLKLQVCGEDVENSKPNPEPYLRAAQALAVPPAECIVFEDSIAGLNAARSAGAWTVAITHGQSDKLVKQAGELAHYLLRDFNQLPADFLAQP